MHKEDLPPMKWEHSINRCGLCLRPLKDFPTFIDGKTTLGPWTVMCPPCHALYGTGLGTGHGQEYDTNTRAKLRG